MLKKVCIHDPMNTSPMESRKICCSACKSSEKSEYYFCKTGRHIICENCQYGVLETARLEEAGAKFCLQEGWKNLRFIAVFKSMNNRRDDGDYVPEPECAITVRKVLSSVCNGIDLQDLSSGDHSTHYEHNTNKNSMNNEINISGTIPTCTSKVHCSNCNNSTIVIYRNERFHNGKSRTIEDLNTPSFINEIKAEYSCEVPRYPNHSEGLMSINSCSSVKAVLKDVCNTIYLIRPVVCPVSSCAKIVTIDTMSQHFNFDHSKIPRLTLFKNSVHEISLKYTSLSAETICLAVFTVSTEKRSSHTLKRVESRTSVHNTDSQLLLLMAAKLSTAMKSEPSIRKSRNNVQGVPRQSVEDYKLRGSKSSPENSFWMNRSIGNVDETEVLLLWLCKTNDKSKVYTINISREDKRQGYSYIGDAVHIKHEQNPNSIYNRTECISIRKTAINKLITAEQELKVIISRVQ